MGQDSGIGVLDKAVTVLRGAVAESPCGLTALCERTACPAPPHIGWPPGWRSTDCCPATTPDAGDQAALAELAFAEDPLLIAGTAVLPQLREITGESVQLYRREGLERVCLAALEPAAGLRDTVPVGARLPMTAGSGAKVLLAHCDGDTVAAVLGSAVFTERAPAIDVRRRLGAERRRAGAGSRERVCARAGSTRRRGRGHIGVRTRRPHRPAAWRPVGRRLALCQR